MGDGFTAKELERLRGMHGYQTISVDKTIETIDDLQRQLVERRRHLRSAKRNAWFQGYMAARQGQSEEANPYEDG
jgi:hypothetical protein